MTVSIRTPMDPGHRGGMGQDAVGRQRHVVAAGGADVEDGGDHRHLAALLEPHDLVIQDVGRGDRAARAVDAEHDRAHPIVVLGLLELLPDPGEQRHLRPALEGEDRLFREDAGQVDQEHLVGAVALDGALGQRLDARREVDRDDAAAGERHEGHREAGETGAHGLVIRVYAPPASGLRPIVPPALKARHAPGIVATPTPRRTHVRPAREPADRRPLADRRRTARDPDPQRLRRRGDQGRASARRRRQPPVGAASRAGWAGVVLLRREPREAQHHDRPQAPAGQGGASSISRAAAMC